MLISQIQVTEYNEKDSNISMYKLLTRAYSISNVDAVIERTLLRYNCESLFKYIYDL